MSQRLTRHVDPKREYDLLIVGAGITGCAMAYEAAAQGLSVAVVDKGDIGGATSAATGKLIHGGLRYLKNMELGLVREALAERRILSNIAPGLVMPVGMVLPDTELIARIGLVAYDLLSFDRNRVEDPAHRIPAHRRLRQGELAAMGWPQIRKGILYYDCMMPQPERLTLAFARSAVAGGAHLLTHAPVMRLVLDGKRVRGAVLQDRVAGREITLQARMVVNATGPWAHDLLSRTPETADLLGPAPATRSEGIYLVTRKLTDVMLLQVSEHGHFSFAPWRGKTLIGPTETPYAGAVEDWHVTAEAVQEFLNRINGLGTLTQPLTLADVEAVYGGLRPLVESEGDSYNASRASELMDHASAGVTGLVTARGGKYTTSRAFAAKSVRYILRVLERRGRGMRTDRVPLTDCGIGQVEEAVSACASGHPDVAPATVAHLVRFYGTAAEDVLALTQERPDLADMVDPDGEILAQAVYAVRQEAAVTLEDVVLRRMALGTLGVPAVDVLDRITAVVAEEAGWDEARAETEKARLLARLRVPVAPELRSLSATA